MFIGPRTYVHRLMNPITPKGGSLQAKRQGRGSLCLARASRHYGSCPMALRLVVTLLLMMVVGVNYVKADDDYSGTYYIASKAGKAEGATATTYDPNNPTKNFYLCPTENWYYYLATNTIQETDNGQPFLTTYKCKSSDYHSGDASDAVWIVQKHESKENCYYIIHKSTGQYMISNGQLTSPNVTVNANRVRVHLETVATNDLDDKALFEITSHGDHLDIVPHSTYGRNGSKNIYLVVNNGNFNNLKADGSKADGPNGTYGRGTGGIIGLYEHEDNAKFAVEIPSLTFTTNESNVEISKLSDVEIYYTTDGSDPVVPDVGEDPVGSTSKYSTAIPLENNQIMIKAIATNKGHKVNTSIQTYVYNPDITWIETSFVYDGTAQVPTQISVKVGENEVPVAEYDISCTDNINAGEATLTLTDKVAGNNYFIYSCTKTFTIDCAEATVKADDKTKVYQTPNLDDPELTAAITGMVNNESESLITYTLSRDVGEDAGLYTITPTGEAIQGNYNVTYEAGVFQIGMEITPAPTVALANWTYGSPNEPSVSGNTGGGDVTYFYKVKGAADDTYTEEVPVNVGDYTVKAEIARTNEYFPTATAPFNFKINKAPLTIFADAITKEYLDEDPELTYTVTGIQYNEDKNNVITCELQRAPGETKGEYAITKTSHQLISGNYSFSSFSGATFTIIAKNLGDPVTLEPAPKISIYAKDNGNESWTVSVYTGKTAFVEGTDYNSYVTGPDDDGNYTVTIAAVEGSNCSGSAQATYSPSTFYDISGITEKFIPYISTTSDLTTSSDLVPYIITQVNSSIGTVSILPISFIPKDVPVLLLAQSDVTGVTTSPKNENTSSISASLLNSNLLKKASETGVHVETTEAYMFYKGEFVLTTEGTIYNAYFIYNPNYHQGSGDSGNSTPAPARWLAIIKAESTGVIQLTNDRKTEGLNDAWYTIDGQRLNKKPTRKGLYIQNGKKHIVK